MDVLADNICAARRVLRFLAPTARNPLFCKTKLDRKLCNDCRREPCIFYRRRSPLDQRIHLSSTEKGRMLNPRADLL